MPHDMEVLSPEYTKAMELNHTGALLFGQGELEPAKLHFLAALNLEPDNHLALQNLGAVLRNQGHHAAAESVARRSVKASGGNAFTRSNLGVSQLSLKKYDEALATLQGVLAELGESAPSWHNYGLALYMVGEYRSALCAFDQTLALNPDNTQCKSDRALTLLALGHLQEGLEAYECRWQLLAKSPVWELGVPEWQGEAVVGKHILVHHEQGFGDSLMLVRFVLPLLGLGAKITLAVPKELVRLFNMSFGHLLTVKDFKSTDFVALNYDYQSPMLSVMRHLCVDQPKTICPAPYLLMPVDPIAQRLPKNRKYRVGICWASGNHGPHLVERRRVTNLTDFLPLTELADTAVVSLQMGREVQDIANNGMQGLIFDLSHRVEDFASTAAIIAELDIVISVDSAVVHLAGALGVPSIMLSPYTRCWRWWQAAAGSGKPWYSNMKVFFQSADGTWTAAIAAAISSVRETLGVD
jgi:Flp pilus assembly protein TadD